jgi:hypothetical protein
LLPLRIGEVLLESSAITTNTYEDIGDLIGKPSKCYNLWENVKNNPTTIPEPTAILDFLELILISARDKLSLQQTNQIKTLVIEYIQSILAANQVKDHLVKYPDCARKDLIERIVRICPILSLAKSRMAMSRLLFDNRDYLDRNFLDTRHTSASDPTPRIFKRPQMPKVWRILLSVSKWNSDSFIELGLNLDASTIEYYKREIKTVIDGWIFENNYPVSYIFEAPRRKVNSYRSITFNKYYLIPEYELIQSLWLAVAIHTDNPQITLTGKKSIASELGYKEVKNILITGEHSIGVDSLRSILLKINKWAGQEADTAGYNILGIPTSEKLGIYMEAMENIAIYMKKRGLSFIKSGTKSKYLNYKELWYKEITKAYHGVFLFAQNLGFDPLTFTTLNDDIFKVYPVQRADGTIMWTSDYRRHHLDPSNKGSMYFSDLTLTDMWKHNYWEKLGESNSRLLLQKFQIMVTREGTGIGGTWTKNDIIRLFQDASMDFQNTILYDERNGWFKNPDFIDNLNNFNDRKSTYQTKGLELLILENNYNNLYERFYKVVKDDEGRSFWMFSKPLVPYGLLDYSNMIALEFYLSRNPNMLQKFKDLIKFKY